MSFIDIAGQKFNRLTATKRIGTDKHGNALWLFKCDCGNDYISVSTPVKKGKFKSCGCLKKEKSVDITGQKFGRLTAIKFIGFNSRNDAVWMFQCDCGKEHEAVAYQVKNGSTRSCGCLMIEMAILANTKHGLTKTRLYRIWYDMRRRCSNPNRKDWPNYGGRGINVCDEWQNDFLAFYNWATSNGYQSDLSIERKNNNDNYCPQNCKWATRKQQNNNTRLNRKITAFGITKNLQQWADETGIEHSTIIYRLQSGWSPENAVSITPILGSNQYV